VRFPEVNAALSYIGASTAEGARVCHLLYRRHAEGIECALGTAFARVGVFDWSTFPPHSLLGVVQGRTALPRPEPATGTAPERGFVVDRKQFQVRLDGRPCFLGSRYEFRVVEYLAQRPARFVPVQELLDDVWGGAKRTANAVQQVVSNVRRMFREDGLTRIEIDGSQPGHYRLVVHPE
jgi:DNA-binding response OmpR family regulator